MLIYCWFSVVDGEPTLKQHCPISQVCWGDPYCSQSTVFQQKLFVFYLQQWLRCAQAYLS